ncbi:MAG: toll/interleukin-1 receptor domain-containing protein [Promethearchaeota archaeon]|jgi:hypothetical protein
MKDKREFKSTKFLAVISLFLILLDIFVMFFASYFTISNVLVIINITFITSNLVGFIGLYIFGVRNKNYYGNYVRSSAVLFLVGSLLWMVNFLEPYFISIGLHEAMIYITYINELNLAVLAGIYFLFFGIRIRNVYFIVFSISWAFYSAIVYINLIFFLLQLYLYTFIGYDQIGFLLLLVFSPVLVGIIVSTRFFELGRVFRRGLRVFVSHAVNDFKRYRVEEIANYLESQKGIGSVLYCETDLTGNIDEWMRKIVPRSNLLLFISTEESMASLDCKNELALAESNNLQVIPVLGVGLAWDDLKDLNLNREYGTSFDPMEFENFCKELHQIIIKYKEAIEADVSSLEIKEKT